MAKKDVFTIGIAGGSGSGKTLIVDTLLKSFPGQICYLKIDNYYKKFTDKSFEERCQINYDAPESFDMDLLCEHVKSLQEGRYINTPIYDFTINNRSDKTEKIEPKSIIIIEGIFALYFTELTKYMDTKVYVDVDDDVRILRRVKRDMEQRGRSLDSIINQYLGTVKPMHEKYISPSKLNANLIIPEGGFNKVGIGVLKDHIQKFIDGDK